MWLCLCVYVCVCVHVSMCVLHTDLVVQACSMGQDVEMRCFRLDM